MKVRIRECALDMGWSLYRLSQEMGVPQQTVYSWASGRTQPSYKNMDFLCTILGAEIGDLFEPEPDLRGDLADSIARRKRWLNRHAEEIKEMERLHNEPLQ